jgi:hypothetical protein
MEVNTYTSGANLVDEWGIDLTAGIAHIFVQSTLSQATGAVGGFCRCNGTVCDIRIGGQATDAATRNTPLIKLIDCKGRLDVGWHQGIISSVGASAAPCYDIALSGNATFNGGIIQVTSAATFLRLSAPGSITEPNLKMYGIVNQGVATVIEHKGGDWAIDVGITGPSGAGNAAIVCDGAAGAGLGISGYVIAGSGGLAIKTIANNQVEIAAKVYGDISIADATTVQFRGAAVVGTVKSTSGTGTAKGVGTWVTSVTPTCAEAGIASTLDATLF